MPFYLFHCCQCGVDSRRREAFGTTEIRCPACGGVAPKVFEVCRQIHIPDSFHYSQAEMLPDKDDHAAWEARTSNSTYHPPNPMADLGDVITEEVRAARL